MSQLRKKYQISYWEEMYCKIVRTIRGSKTCPKFLFKKSYRKYGKKNNLARYYIEKYEGVCIGKYTFGSEYISRDMVKSIGNYCSISQNVHLVRNTHRTDWTSTHPFLYEQGCNLIQKDITTDTFGPVEHSITIGNDVWLADNCIIFHGVKIGDGAVIAAGAIVTKDVPPYAVVIGFNKIVKYRFNKITIEKLLKIKWWDFPEEKLKLYSDIMKEPEKFISAYERDNA